MDIQRRNKGMSKNSRNSNLELLRCILMLMLLILHFNGQALGLPTAERLQTLPLYIALARFGIEGFTIIVVNCFVLISGYFGIKTNFKKVFTLYFECLFYGIISLFILHTPDSINAKEVGYSFLVFSHSPLWFITSYFGLLLFAPLLNKAIENSNTKQHLYFIMLLTVFNIYLGWFWHVEGNANAYCTLQFIYLYFIGSYLKRISSLLLKIKKSWFIIGYLFCSITITLMAYATVALGVEKHLWLHALSYHNPLIILSACFFLLLFTKFTLKSKFINWVAQSSLAIYIIHSLFWPIIYEKVSLQAKILSLPQLLFWCIGAIITIYIVSILIDKIRIIISQPIEDYISKATFKLKNQFYNKVSLWFKNHA